jgi:preprotein translocase subunit SecF
MLVWGFNLGIDFKGGSVLEVAYTTTRPSLDQANAGLAALKLSNYSLIPTGDTGYILRTKDITPAEKTSIENALSQNGKFALEEKQFDSIGPLLGQESKNKALISISLVLLAIVVFIAFAFRKVSKPISSWIYGLVAIVALVHDVIIPTGVFVLLGHFKNFEIDTLFVTALLVILGFSIHDTIVVFDRVRENLRHDMSHKKPFEQIVGESISQTFTRSINTSLTVLLSLLVLYFVGSVATHNFVLALLVGITAGTYSSIFIGSPLLVTIAKWQNKNK